MGKKRIKNKALIIKKISGLMILIFVTFFFSAPCSKAQSEIKMILKIKDFQKEVSYEKYSEWFSLTPSITLDRSYLSEIENTDLCDKYLIFCKISKTEKTKLHVKKTVSMDFDKQKAQAFLEELSKESDRLPINAKFKMGEEKAILFVQEEPGHKLNIEKSLDIISKSFLSDNDLQRDREFNLAYDKVEPEIKSSDINSLGINTLIGQGRSNFKGSPKSRIHNIKIATEKYNGFLLSPGKEFSFVEVLGPVDGEHGYLPELVIKNNKTEPEFGGGICQVSTTAFRAAIYSGLEITARKNHAYPVQYYNPQGMDATIYIPKPDLRFKNNTPGHILMQTEIVGTELIFSFFGTDDGRKVEISGPYIVEKNSDGSIRTTFTQKVSDEDNTVFIDETFNSFYDSPAKYPHPGEEIFREKPADWSKKQWEEYRKIHNL